LKYSRINFRKSFRHYFAEADFLQRKTRQRMFYALKIFIPDMERYYCEPRVEGGGYDVYIEKKTQRVCIGTSETNISFPKKNLFYYRKELRDFDRPYQMFDAHSFDRMVNACYFNKIPRDERIRYKYRSYLLSDNYDYWKQKQREFEEGFAGLKIRGTNSRGQNIEITTHSIRVKKLHYRDGRWLAGAYPVTAYSHFIIFMGIKKETFNLFLSLLDKRTTYCFFRLIHDRIACWSLKRSRWEINFQEYKP
jgi:hypothetical protein